MRQLDSGNADGCIVERVYTGVRSINHFLEAAGMVIQCFATPAGIQRRRPFIGIGAEHYPTHHQAEDYGIAHS